MSSKKSDKKLDSPFGETWDEVFKHQRLIKAIRKNKILYDERLFVNDSVHLDVSTIENIEDINLIDRLSPIPMLGELHELEYVDENYLNHSCFEIKDEFTKEFVDHPEEISRKYSDIIKKECVYLLYLYKMYFNICDEINEQMNVLTGEILTLMDSVGGMTTEQKTSVKGLIKKFFRDKRKVVMEKLSEEFRHKVYDDDKIFHVMSHEYLVENSKYRKEAN